MKLLLPLFAALMILGSGCLPDPTPTMQQPFEYKKEITIAPNNEQSHTPLCLKFSSPTGFINWIEGYEKGEDLAITLATSISLPKEAEPNLIQNAQTSVTSSMNVRYFCSLDAERRSYAWVADVVEPHTKRCLAMAITSLNGKLTIADMQTQSARESCNELCAPKYQNDTELVWQCDVLETDITTEWSEIHMNRSTGASSVHGCKITAEGTTPGCVR